MARLSPVHLFFLASLAGCATSRPELARDGLRLTPREAVMAAADAAPAGVPGLFALHVTATGREGGRVYLNSEQDYRDQRNLTINIAPRAADALERRHGAPPDIFFRGRQVEVRGTARRTRIDFISRDRPTGLYYYRTQVAVSDADQISIVG